LFCSPQPRRSDLTITCLLWNVDVALYSGIPSVSHKWIYIIWNWQLFIKYHRTFQSRFARSGSYPAPCVWWVLGVCRSGGVCGWVIGGRGLVWCGRVRSPFRNCLRLVFRSLVVGSEISRTATSDCTRPVCLPAASCTWTHPAWNAAPCAPSATTGGKENN